SAGCRRFKESAHVLYLSATEAEFLLETAPPYTTPVSPDGCPFQVDKLCTARDERPLGCRIYFCDPAYQETGNALTESSLAKLKRLADEHGLEWRYAPLHVFLNESDRRLNTEPRSRVTLRIV